MMEILTKNLYDQNDVAALLGVSKQTLYNWRRNGQLPCTRKIGRKYYYRKDELEELLK